MTGNCSDKRNCRRYRTRLRSGKLVTLRNAFLSDCQIFDRSRQGARVRLAGRMDLPEYLRLFDDELQILFTARVIWRRGCEAGLHFIEPRKGLRHSHREERLIRSLKEKYYALGRKG